MDPPHLTHPPSQPLGGIPLLKKNHFDETYRTLAYKYLTIEHFIGFKQYMKSSESYAGC